MGRRFHSFRSRKLILPAILAASFCFGSVTSRSAQETAFDLAGKPLEPLKAANGKAVVLIFVRTDCPVSNRYAPLIQKLSEHYPERARFWLVYPDKKADAGVIRQHDREFGYKIPALRDPQHALVKLSQAKITPEAAVFDARGRLVYHGRIDDLYVDMARSRRAATTHELDDAIQAAVSGRNVTLATKPAVGCYISDLE